MVPRKFQFDGIEIFEGDTPACKKVMLEKIQTTSKNLKEIQPIKDSRGILITNREKIAEIVEVPLLKACQILYDKNIETRESTANMENITDGQVGITINFDSLSDENQEIARENCEIGDHPDGYCG